MKSFSKILLPLVVAVVPAVAEASALVTIEPDDYAVGTDLSSIASGVHITSYYGDAVHAASSYLGTAPTGSLVFGQGWSWMPGSGFGLNNNLFTDHYLSDFGGDGLLIHFDQPTTYVSVLGYGPAYAQIWAYDAAGNRLGTSVENVLSPRDTLYFSEASYSAAAGLIAYALIGGYDSSNIEIDRLQYMSAVPVPPAFGSMAMALSGLLWWRRKK